AELSYGGGELVAGDLEEAGGGALAEPDLAEEDRRRVVAVDREPAVDRARIGRTGDVAARGRRGVLARKAEADDEGAAALDEVAARELELAHFAPPAVLAAASTIAFITRG